jgi:hypothetical protein
MFDARDIRRDLGPAQPLVDQSLANLQTPGTRWVARQVSWPKAARTVGLLCCLFSRRCAGRLAVRLA